MPSDDAMRERADNVQYQPRRKCPDCDGNGWLFGDPCPLCYGPHVVRERAMDDVLAGQYRREKGGSDAE